MNIVVKSFRILRLIRAMANLAKSPNPQYVFDISDACNKLNMYGLSKEMMLIDPSIKKSVDEMWLLPKISIQEFSQKAPGSFAREYAEHMLELGYDPEFWRKSEIRNDITYITVRMRQTHDFWHIMTGFDTTKPGEIGLQGFVLAQTGLPISMLLVGGALFRACFVEIRSIPKLMEAIVSGYRMGKLARPIFPIKWEEIWDRPLHEIRLEYNVIPFDEMKKVA